MRGVSTGPAASSPLWNGSTIGAHPATWTFASFGRRSTRPISRISWKAFHTPTGPMPPLTAWKCQSGVWRGAPPDHLGSIERDLAHLLGRHHARTERPQFDPCMCRVRRIRDRNVAGGGEYSFGHAHLAQHRDRERSLSILERPGRPLALVLDVQVSGKRSVSGRMPLAIRNYTSGTSLARQELSLPHLCVVRCSIRTQTDQRSIRLRTSRSSETMTGPARCAEAPILIARAPSPPAQQTTTGQCRVARHDLRLSRALQPTLPTS